MKRLSGIPAHDWHTLYFTGKSGIQQFSLTPWLDARRR
jgi:hypothetical protein